MPKISHSVVEPALLHSDDPLAAELLARLRAQVAAPGAKATRPFPIREALRIYRHKAALGDRPAVRTEGYQTLLAALAAGPEKEVIVHGLTFLDAIYLVFTDPDRTRCIGLLRKVRTEAGAHDDSPTAADAASSLDDEGGLI